MQLFELFSEKRIKMKKYAKKFTCDEIRFQKLKFVKIHIIEKCPRRQYDKDEN